MQYGDVDIKCPFYIEQTKNTIKCEGIVSVTCSNNFSTTKAKREHQKYACCDKYQGCALYRILELKY